MAEKSIEEEVMLKAAEARKLAKYMSSTADLVEEQIQKAFRRGDFDNLAGEGQPLDLYENPFEPVELRMTFKILKNNDFAPYWIELGKELDADILSLNKEVEQFKRYVYLFMREKHSNLSIKRLEKRKNNFYYEIRLKLEKMHQKIIDFNLHCPTFQEGRANFSVDDKMLEVIMAVEQVIDNAINGEGCND